MKCDKIQKEIIKGHGVAIPADSAEHISKCQKCIAFLDDYKKISKLKLRQSIPSPVLDETILNFAVKHKKEKYFSVLKFFIPFTAAACFIGLLMIFMNMDDTKTVFEKETLTMNKLPSPITGLEKKSVKIISQNSKNIRDFSKKNKAKELAKIESELIEIVQVLENNNSEINNEFEQFSSQIFNMELELN